MADRVLSGPKKGWRVCWRKADLMTLLVLMALGVGESPRFQVH